MELALLKSIMVIFILSVVVLLFCSKFKIPSIVGYLITGIIAGPYGLELISEIHEVEVLAEIGVILLLFTIGIEFSFEKLLQLKKAALLGGTLQVLLTIGFTALLMLLGRQSLGEAVFIGFLVSLSSTAIVIKLLEEKVQIDSVHGRSILGILIFQDIIIVPMILVTPILAGTGGSVSGMTTILIKIVAIILMVFSATKWIVPFILHKIVQTRNREIFLLSIVVICFMVAWLTSSAGLSLALGAFLAGLIISESEFSHQALGSVLPFRDVFISFFFVSIGMLLNLGFFMAQPGLILIIVLGVLLLKMVIASIAGLALGLPLRSSLLIGFALCQIGEFSFILSKSGLEYQLLKADMYQFFLSVSILSMAVTPLIMAYAPRLACFITSNPFLKKSRINFELDETSVEGAKEDHLVIVGYGLNGRNVARAAEFSHIPFVIIEMNADTVKKEREKEKPIFYGDAVQETVLLHANIKSARIMVIAISDPAATRRIIELGKRLNPNLYIIVRTRYLVELESLIGLGADEVIPEEFETSVEIFTRVLNKYLIPKDEIESFIFKMRSDNYHMFRSYDKIPYELQDLNLSMPDISICSIRIPEGSFASGKTLAELGLRNNYGVTAVAVYNKGKSFPNPQGDTYLYPSDILIVLGTRRQICKTREMFGLSNSLCQPDRA